MSFKYSIQDLTNISILEYGQSVYGLTPTRKRSQYWGFKEYDSLMVLPNNTFFYNKMFVIGQKSSQNGDSAGSVINFIMWYEGVSKKEAIKKLTAYAEGINLPISNLPNKPIFTEEKKEFIVPVPYKDNNAAYRYLCKVRKINPVVFNYLVKHKYVYEERGYKKNIIFCSYNKDGKMDFAQRYATVKNVDRKKRKRDVAGSVYYQCWYIDNGASSLIVTEAPINTASFMTLLMRFNKRFVNYNHQGLTGSNKIKATADVLEDNPHITKVYLGVDNDEAGDHAYQWLLNWQETTGWCGKIIRITPSTVNDLNDVLVDNDNDVELFKKIKKM